MGCMRWLDYVRRKGDFMSIKGNVVYSYFDNPFSIKPKIGIGDLESIDCDIAGFENEKQMKKFLKKLGVKVIHRNIYTGSEPLGTDYDIKNSNVKFWDKKSLPRGAKKIKALSNGSLVDCYFTKDKQNKTIEIYRPNPNAKKVYRPLSVKKHIKYTRKHGVY